MKFTYVGRHTDGVEIPGVGFVAHGGTIDVPDEIAAGLAEQTDAWRSVKSSKSTPTTITAGDGEEDQP